MTVLWKAPLLRGDASLKGNREVDFAQWEGKRFPDQSQIIDGPISGWKAVRCEVKCGDKDPRYSDQRIILDASPSKRIGRVDEGDETWTRFCEMWPENWVGYFPKWDQLADWPNIKHSGGSSGEWHHGPLDENWSNFGGSAPIYMGATDKEVTVRINKYVSRQSGGVADAGYTLAPLQRGKWYDHIIHGIWSANPSKGLLEFFIDGKLVATYRGMTIWPECYNWFLCGLYRNFNIGCPTNQKGEQIVWPVDAKTGIDYGKFVPKKGQSVFTDPDGFPQQVYLSGMIIGTTKDDVVNAYTSPSGAAVPDPTQPPAVTPVPTPVPDTGVQPQTSTPNLPAKAVDGLKQLIAQRQQLEPLIPRMEAAIAQMQAATTQMQGARDAAKKVLDDTTTILNRGPW